MGPSSTTVDKTSEPFVGQWQGLVSTTNWDKGRIIAEWRDALVNDDAPASEYSDEVWSLLVGNVTPQHVGRLRRVHERFSLVREQYDGLFWSHFHAAIDWDDAEMWLEGALQNGWSVSQMRRQRWETLGSVSEEKPLDADIVEAEVDEDFPADAGDDSILVDGVSEVVGFEDEESPSKPATKSGESRKSGAPSSNSVTDGPDADGAAIFSDDPEGETVEFVRPFEKLAELPDDVTDAFESFKLAILRHKMDEWKEVSRDDLLASLDALKELALAPSSGVPSAADSF